MVIRKRYKGPERRKYIRLNFVFPVEFQLAEFEGKAIASNWQQGFSSDFGSSGICLKINNPPEEIASRLSTKDTRLSLYIHIPISGKPTRATAKTVWSRKTKKAVFDQYTVGLAFEDIDKEGLKKILRYVNWTRFVTKSAVYIIIALVILCLIMVAIITRTVKREIGKATYSTTINS